MIWLIHKLLGALGWIKRAGSAIWTAATKHPREAVIVVLLALCAFLAWSNAGLRADVANEIAAHKADNDLFRRAQKEAERLALENKLRIETKYKDNARDADAKYQGALADARSTLDSYIASHRVRAGANTGPASNAPAPASGGDTGISQSLPADSILVSEQDLRRCDGAVTYAIAAHEWALTLEQVK